LAAREVDAGEVAPLSVAQEAMWYTARLHPKRLIYNETFSIRTDGPLDPDTARRTLEELLRRHESLRTRLPVSDGRPVQVVDEVPLLDLPLLDLGHMPFVEADREAVQLVAETSRAPYDLRESAMVRPSLFRLPGGEHRLYLAIHHVAFDGVSLSRVLMPEFVAIYTAFAAGLPSPLADPPVRYVDYARWEQEWIDTPRAERRIGYWIDRLTSAPTLPLPLDHERPEEPHLGGGAISIALPGDQSDVLREVGKTAGASLFQVLSAGWALVLSRYSGRREVVFATAADLRQRPEFSSLVGCCMTPLVMQLDVDDRLPFADLVLRTRNELLDGLDHLVPFERVVRQLPGLAAQEGNPVYQTMVVLEPADASVDHTWSLHQIDPLLVDAVGNFKLDLELQLCEQPTGEVIGQLIYDRDLFERATVAGIVECLKAVWAAAAANPGGRVADFPRPAEDAVGSDPRALS
jgi:hypothetical protein